MEEADIKYISDENGNRTAVMIPIELCHEMRSEKETEYLLQNEAMKQRLLGAKSRQQGISLKVVYEKLGIRS